MINFQNRGLFSGSPGTPQYVCLISQSYYFILDKCPFQSGKYVLKSLDAVENTFIEKQEAKTPPKKDQVHEAAEQKGVSILHKVFCGTSIIIHLYGPHTSKQRTNAFMPKHSAVNPTYKNLLC